MRRTIGSAEQSAMPALPPRPTPDSKFGCRRTLKKQVMSHIIYNFPAIMEVFSCL